MRNVQRFVPDLSRRKLWTHFTIRMLKQLRRKKGSRRRCSATNTDSHALKERWEVVSQWWLTVSQDIRWRD